MLGLLFQRGCLFCTLQPAPACPGPLQTVEHPGNLWDVVFMPNSDLVTACSDHVARVWSRDGSRQAPGEVQKVGRVAGAEQGAR